MTYLEWNEKLANYYFNNSNNKPFFLLNATEMLLQELNSYKEDSLYDFIEAVKKGPIDNTNPSRFDFNPSYIGQNKRTRLSFITKAFWLKEVWREKKTYTPSKMYSRVYIWSNELVPPYLAYLFFLVLNIDKNGEEAKYWQHISDVSKDKVDSNDGNKVMELFKDFKKHTQEKYKNEFFYINVYSRGGRKYVGTIYSQLPLKPKEKTKIISFFKDCGIKKEDVELLSNDELINLIQNAGSHYFENHTIEVLKLNENPNLVELILEEIKLTVQNQEEWTIDLKIVEQQAKERIKNNAKLHLIFYQKHERFTLRLSSEQDFTKIDFENGYSVTKQDAYFSENIKDSQNKSILIQDFSKIPKFKYEGKTIKHSFNHDFILLDHYSNDIYFQSTRQESAEAYIVVFRESVEIKKLIEGKHIEVMNLQKQPIANGVLYKTNTYLDLTGLDERNPRITFTGGAKKDTGLYSYYWLPKLNFHYADNCELEILNIHKEQKCPDSLDLQKFKTQLQQVDKITIQLKKNHEIVAEKELFINTQNDIATFNNCIPCIMDGVSEDKSYEKFNSKLLFPINSNDNYNWHLDKLLIELSSVASEAGFIPTKRFSTILYLYLKDFFSSGIEYVKDLRDPIIKMLQGFGYIKKSYDVKGNYKGVFISAPYLLPICTNEVDTKYVLRGARSEELINKLLTLKKDKKISRFEQRAVSLFTNERLNTIFPSEIYFSTPMAEQYVDTLSPRKVAERLGIKLIDIALEQPQIETLPKSFNDLKKSKWYGDINFSLSIDNPLNTNPENYQFPVLLSFQSSTYLQPQYVVFEENSQYIIDKNWGIFYTKAIHQLPLFYLGHSWNSANQNYECDRLYIREYESIPEEIFTILCIANREQPRLISFKLSDDSENTYYIFERIDLKVIDQIINKYSIEKSVIKITNPNNNHSKQLSI